MPGGSRALVLALAFTIRASGAEEEWMSMEDAARARRMKKESGHTIRRARCIPKCGEGQICYHGLCKERHHHPDHDECHPPCKDDGSEFCELGEDHHFRCVHEDDRHTGHRAPIHHDDMGGDPMRGDPMMHDEL